MTVLPMHIGSLSQHLKLQSTLLDIMMSGTSGSNRDEVGSDKNKDSISTHDTSNTKNLQDYPECKNFRNYN